MTILFLLNFIFLQVPDSTFPDNRTLEMVTDYYDLEEDADLSEIYENLEHYKNRPLNINSATREDMEGLQLLNHLQIEALLSYRKNYGLLNSINELTYIPGFSEENINMLRPFISVSKQKTEKYDLRRTLKYGKHTIMFRLVQPLAQKAGFANQADSTLKSYLGSPQQLWMRYQFNASDKVKLSFVAKKDGGEEFFKGSQKQGFSFYSGYVAVNDLNIVKNIVAGNYQLQFGQGLCLWQGMSFGKSINGSGLKKRGQGIKPYGSSSEYDYSQGIATCLRIKSVDISLFYSSLPIDANVSNVDEHGKAMSISSIIKTGYHRTIDELNKKKQALQTLYGVHLDYRMEKFKLGATLHQNHLNATYSPTPKLYNQFSTPPSDNTNGSLDFEGIFSICRYYGELAFSANGGTAFLVGTRLLLDQRVSANILFRNYSKDYQNFFSNAIGENSTVSNERGLNINILTNISRKVNCSFMIDYFHFPWLSFSLDKPLYGMEYQLKTEYNRNHRENFYIHYRYKEKPVNSKNEEIREFASNSKHTLRIHYENKISEFLILKSRFEYNRSTNSKGSLIYQEIVYKPASIPLSVALRYAVFDTDDYDARIYAFENDVLYAYASQSYYHKGSRFYITAQYNINRSLTLWVKFANTYTANKLLTGSGLDEIKGHDKPEIKFQIRWKIA